MDNTSWRLTVQANLQDLASQAHFLLPGTYYGQLAATVLTPVINAFAEHDFGPLVSLFSVIGGVGGNQIANQMETWQKLSPQEVAIDLMGKAAADAEWRNTLDTLLQEFGAAEQLIQNLKEDARAGFLGIFQQELEQLGSQLQLTLTDVTPAEPPQPLQSGVNIGGDLHESVLNIGGNVTQNYYVQQETTTDPIVLRTAYLNRLFNQANALSLAGVDPKAASDETEARLHLGAVYTALLTTSLEAAEYAAQEQPVQHAERQISAIAQLNRHRRLVLLGDPGSGKSTFVNFVALCLAGEGLGKSHINLSLLTAPLPDDLIAAEALQEEAPPQPWVHGALLPVRVILRDFAARGLPTDGSTATASHLWRFISSELEAAALNDFVPILHKELMNQCGLILLDGLDEVPDADSQRTQIKHAIEDFADTFLHCRILVTSRTYAYQHQEWRLNGFTASVLAPFSKGQIATFVDHWYAHIGELRHLQADDAQGRAELLKHAIFSSNRLHALAERPLLLTLTASLHAWRGGSLPDRREELYADAVDLLLDWWESQRVARDAQGNIVLTQPSLTEWLRVDRGKVRTLLNQVAFEAHASQPTLVGTADIPESMLVTQLLYINENEDVKPRLLMAYLSQRAGLLLPRGIKNYTFPHRTFQEYLAACYLTDFDFPDTIAELTRQDPNRWREVTLLAGAKAARGTASAIWVLADALCFRAPTDPDYGPADVWGAHLAGQAVVEAVNLSQSSPRHQAKLRRIADSLVHALRSQVLPPTERAQASRSLARINDPRPEVSTLEQMAFCYVPPGPFSFGDTGDTRDLNAPYWIARFPVTNAQYQRFVEAGGYHNEAYWTEARYANFWQSNGFKGRYDSRPRTEPRRFSEPYGFLNHPVVGISWYEALAFVRWLDQEARKQGWLSLDWQIQLPSELEWEKAARGGRQYPEQPRISSLHELPPADFESLPLIDNPLASRLYPWGNLADPECANFERTEIGTTNGVGCFPLGASPYGVEEMSGNVWEWTRSLERNTPYPNAGPEIAERERLNAHPETQRILRGGAYQYYEYFVRCAERYSSPPDDTSKLYGFRPVITRRYEPSL